MAKRQEEVVETTNTYVPKKTNKGLIAVLIVIAVLVVLASVILPFVFIIGLAFIFDGNLDYEVVNDTTINIKDVGISVSVEDTFYDKEEECFVLSTKVEKYDKSTRKGLFGDYSYLEVEYTFKDKDGYVVGNESLYIDKIEKYDKWKKEVYYCGTNAMDVQDFEVEGVISE